MMGLSKPKGDKMNLEQILQDQIDNDNTGLAPIREHIGKIMRLKNNGRLKDVYQAFLDEGATTVSYRTFQRQVLKVIKEQATV